MGNDQPNWIDKELEKQNEYLQALKSFPDRYYHQFPQSKYFIDKTIEYVTKVRSLITADRLQEFQNHSLYTTIDTIQISLKCFLSKPPYDFYHRRETVIIFQLNNDVKATFTLYQAFENFHSGDRSNRGIDGFLSNKTVLFKQQELTDNLAADIIGWTCERNNIFTQSKR
jgi:hypothetical protein